jgi:putative membrane protein
MDVRVYEAAFLEFYSSGLYRTREANGVLIYLSVFEKRVVVIGDRGIHSKMGTQHWDAVRDRIIEGIKQGRARDGICAAIQGCGEALAKHFPHQADDVNELFDQVIERKIRPDAP